MDPVEQAAIEAATAYAVANGYDAGDRTAIGLVLAGMVIGAMLSDKAEAGLIRGYLAQHPGTQPSLYGWAHSLNAVAA